jgi:EcsC family protein
MATRIKRARAKSNVPARVQMTDYESEQVKQIAVWKSQPTNAFAEMFRRITSPGVKLVERVLPDATVRAAITQSFKIAEKLADKEDVRRRAGVKNMRDLRRKQLEECDQLAIQTGAFSQILATAQGTTIEVGGVLTMLVDIPLLFILSLRTILKIGHCFGYSLDQRRNQHFIIGALIAAISGTLETRMKRLDKLHEIQDLLITDTQEEPVSKALLLILFQLELFEGIPGVGAISGAALNLAFMRRVDNTARRVFQERWLKDNG